MTRPDNSGAVRPRVSARTANTRGRRFLALAGIVLAFALTTAACGGDEGDRGATRTGPSPAAAAPYLYLGAGHPPDPVAVMSHTGVRAFTVAFVLSGGGCAPAWDGQRGLGGEAAAQIARIRRARGQVTVAVGGAAGPKLGEHCPNPRALAGAYQEVIHAYHLTVIDVDVENSELENPRAQDRVLRALKIVERHERGITTVVTLPASPSGLDRWGIRMVRRAAELAVPVDTWTIMPFNFGGHGAMGGLAITAAEHAHDQISAAYPDRSRDGIDRMLGISLMNGISDTGEVLTAADFRQVRAYARRHHLARFTFWSVNRDRPCPKRRAGQACSGLSQQPWQFTKIIRGYAGRGSQATP